MGQQQRQRKARRPWLETILVLATCLGWKSFALCWQQPPPHQQHQHQGQPKLLHESLSRQTSRRQWLTQAATTAIATTAIAVATTTTTISTTDEAQAAPPIAIIAQELGYFPVTNSQGKTVYIPKRVTRESSPQAIALAQYLSTSNNKKSNNNNNHVYETYWCPHSARQRELFGRQAWDLLVRNHIPIECSSNGYQGQPQSCSRQQVDGYPTWILWNPNDQQTHILPGERSLKELAMASGFPGIWEDSLEINLPVPLGSSSCR